MSKGRIMIVEDESLVAEDLNTCLARSGYEVVGVADTFAAATALATAARPDLALLDIRIKGARDGIELASELRRRDIGYVYLTSHSDDGTLARAEQTEPLGYVLKPFAPREMLPVLRTAMYRHAAEVRHRNMELWLQTVLRSIGDGVIVTDAETRLTYVNPTAEQLLGRTLRNVLGVPLRDVLRVVVPGVAGVAECIAARVIAGAATIALDPDAELVREDGTRLPIDDCAAPIRDPDGKVTGVVIVIRDATARRRVDSLRIDAERRMQDAERLESLGVVASGLAHDLNNILTAILGNVSLCRVAEPATAREPLGEIEANARAAAGLCRRMLAGAGAAPVEPEAVDVAEVVEQCIANERAVGVGNVEFVVSPTPGLRVLAEELQLRQVVLNLVRNSVEALADRRGVVQIAWQPISLPSPRLPDGGVAATLPTGRYMALAVIDDGPGIPSDVRARMFEPFFTTKSTGRGLGLASVHAIVRRHGGGIECESERGAGTAFRVYWPLATDHAASAGHQATPERSLGRHSVLVVEDDAAVRRVICRLLSHRGWVCHEATGGEQAFASLAAGLDIAGAIVDASACGMPAREFLMRLREQRPDLSVLLLSGGAAPIALPPEDAQTTFLAKPFLIGTLLQRLEKWRERVPNGPA